MDTVFGELLKNMDEGRRAALVSKYGASGVKRSLATTGSVGEGDMPCEGISIINDKDELTMIEMYAPKPRLVILGGGHIALPLSKTGAMLGFRVAVFDDRPSFANEARFPDAHTVICDSFDNVMERLKINQNDYVIIVTRGHQHDSLCLRGILQGEAPGYTGMIGSRRRVAIVKKQMEEETGETEKLASLFSPIGLPIGATTPEEIAISILAEVIQQMRLGPVDSAGVRKTPQKFLNPDMELLTWLAGEHERAAIATIVASEGSTPREKGAKMAVLANGKTIGSIGGGCAEADVIRKAVDIAREGGYCMTGVDLTDTAGEDGMVCGGSMRVLIEAV